jgi:hypothetical protein
VPRYYTWNFHEKTFLRRKQGDDVQHFPGIKSANALGRVYTVHPTSNAECYFLHMLLHSVRGPTSFNDLKEVNGTTCTTYREACERRGLLEHDQHWEKTMREASESQMPNSLRHLFCIIVTTCSIANPLALWVKFKQHLSEDLLHQLKEKNEKIEIHDIEVQAENKTLCLLEEICLSISGKLLPHFGIPSANKCAEKTTPSLLLKEKQYNKTQLEAYIAQKEPQLLPDQKLIYDEILQSVQEKKERIFFIDAPGGTGKTFLLNLLLAKVRKNDDLALAVASSG